MLKLPPGRWDSRNEWLFERCPFCQHEFVFSYNVEKAKGKCWRPSCRGVIGSKNFFRNYSSKLVDISQYRPEAKSFQGLSELVTLPAWECKRAREFLLGRACSAMQAYSHGFRFDPQRGLLYVPLSPLSDDLPVSYAYRNLNDPNSYWRFATGTRSKYYVFNKEAIKANHTILICEGVFDLVATGLDYSGIALMGAKINQELFDYFSTIKPRRIIGWFDADPAGDLAATRLATMAFYFGIHCDIVKTKNHPKDYLKFLNHPIVVKLRSNIANESNYVYNRYTFEGGKFS